MDDNALINQKINQAVEILTEIGIDTWLTFVRETNAGGDPILPLIYGHDLTWQSALILTSSGKKIAVVGRFEKETAESLGAYQVLGYDEGISEVLRSTLMDLKPQFVAVNTSKNDVLADGLSHGMYGLLTDYLAGTGLAENLVSAERLIGALRARKTPLEIERIKTAVRTTEEIYRQTFDFLSVDKTEIEVAEFMHRQVKIRGLETAWETASCPAVNAGPDTPVGHGAPTEIRIKPGHIVHFDFGVKENGYCSDIQRVVYMLRSDEDHAPLEVQHGFRTIVQAIQQAVAAIQPGVMGIEIDAIARAVVIDAGYPEFKYATGHQMGRIVHDGGTLLGPKWERYGNLPEQVIEPGHVYTIEPGLMVPAYGYIGIEEDILVTESGAIFLSEPQTELILLR